RGVLSLLRRGASHQRQPRLLPAHAERSRRGCDAGHRLRSRAGQRNIAPLLRRLDRRNGRGGAAPPGVETVVRFVAAILLAALAVPPAFAQGSAQISTTEREMVAAYGALLGKLTDGAKLHLERDQERWLANRRGCDANAALKAGCLEARYQSRAAKLS